VGVADWSFPSDHARVLLCIAHDPGVRLRDIAARTSVTERTAYGIVTDLTEAGYVVKRLVVIGQRVMEVKSASPARTRTGPDARLRPIPPASPRHPLLLFSEF
jgi:hypothetical protein